jgi:hypothetical protein
MSFCHFTVVAKSCKVLVFLVVTVTSEKMLNTFIYFLLVYLFSQEKGNYADTKAMLTLDEAKQTITGPNGVAWKVIICARFEANRK